MEIVEEGHQVPNHPAHPAIPETVYLKKVVTRLLPSYICLSELATISSADSEKYLCTSIS